ncbi:MAG: polysaccharide biosynthesis C-terminal domain-containing protein [Chitinophagaceae bacterium]|nr:polysaccharide biosynthesis C-terminal domain-containing protein [Chitinophagaceae bacterium]
MWDTASLINYIISPLIAQYFANGEMDRLQNLVTRTSRLVFFISLPLAIIIMLFSRPFMSFFDADLYNGHLALLILCAGQIVNVVCGSVGLVLLMTGHQRYSILSVIIAVLLNAGLNLALIPKFGLTGTAIATATSMIAWNIMMYIFALKKIKINTFALVKLKKS